MTAHPWRVRALAPLLAALVVTMAPATAAAQSSTATTWTDSVTANTDRVELRNPNPAAYGIATVEVSGTYTGTMAFNVRGTSYSTVLCTAPSDGSTATGTTSGQTGKWTCPASGWTSVSVVGTSAMTGTATVRISYGSGGSSAGAGGGGGGGVVDTELPAVETPADALSNGTQAPRMLAFMMGYNGTTWDRARLTTDPCTGARKTIIPINISTATTTELTPSLAGSGNHYFVCSINIGPTGGAQNFALVDDDSDGCGSVTSGLAGGTTANSGWNVGTNGGLVLGNGNATVAMTNGTNRVLCAVTSAAVQTSGVMGVVVAQ